MSERVAIPDLLDDDVSYLLEADALEQIGRYLDHAALGEGWLVTFDLRKELSWAEKLFTREVEHAGKRIHLVGC